VSVLAPTATAADALATALCILPPAQGTDLLRTIDPVRAIVTEADGSRQIYR
jgi:thiamine biosynthesis lipoprotein ApbE